jgi:6-phospho-beta-glucosidase
LVLSVISRNINVKEIALIGRREKKLSIVAEFCQRILDKSGFPARIVGTCDVAEGIAGAKYIINHIRVGGMEARLRDEKIPPKYGMLGDETLGAGGFANAMRTLPVVFDHARLIEQISPEAIVINLTNPLSIIMEALIKYSHVNAIGVCDLPHIYIKRVAKLLHHNPEDLWVDYIGLNHLGWIQDVKIGERSCMSQVLDRIERHKEDGFDTELTELFRMIPTRTVSMYFHREDILRQQKACSRFRAEVLQEVEGQILQLYEDKHLCDVPELTRERNAVWYDETIVPLIEALESREPREIILCVRNGDSIRDLPEDASVEVPVRVSNRGLKQRKVGSCPRFLKGLFVAVKESDRLTVEAVRHKSYELALQALTVNPLVPSLRAARRFLDRFIKEEQVELH